MAVTRRQFLAGLIGAIAAGKLIEKLELVALPKWVANPDVTARGPVSQEDLARMMRQIYGDALDAIPDTTPFLAKFDSRRREVWYVRVRS